MLHRMLFCICECCFSINVSGIISVWCVSMMVLSVLFGNDTSILCSYLKAAWDGLWSHHHQLLVVISVLQRSKTDFRNVWFFSTVYGHWRLNHPHCHNRFSIVVQCCHVAILIFSQFTVKQPINPATVNFYSCKPWIHLYLI